MLCRGVELLLMVLFPLNSVQSSVSPPVMSRDSSPDVAYTPGQSYLSLVLLALTVGLSGSIYLCVLRYICNGCCQPIGVGPEESSLSGVV